MLAISSDLENSLVEPTIFLGGKHIDNNNQTAKIYSYVKTINAVDKISRKGLESAGMNVGDGRGVYIT